MKTLLKENETLTQIVYDAGQKNARPPASQHVHPPGRIHQSISRKFLRTVGLKTIQR